MAPEPVTMSKAVMSEAVMAEVTPEPVMMTEAMAPVSPSAARVAWHYGDEKESDR
jgi:hypothetical protein